MSQTKKPLVDFRAIRARLAMERVLSHYRVLHTFKRNGIRLIGPCPLHRGGNPTQFHVDTEKNTWICFSECRHSGNVLDFICYKEDISIHDAALKACEWFSVPLEEVEIIGAQHKQQAPADYSPSPTFNPPRVEPGSSPENATPNKPLKSRLDKLDRAHPHFTECGISQETIIDFGLGYFTGNKGLMAGHIAIPIHNVKSEVVAYAGRWAGNPPNGTPEYILPAGFRKNLELFNLDRAIQEPADKPLVLVEWFFDAVKLHQHGCRKVVALMGCTMSAAQEELIRKHTNGQSQAIVMFRENEVSRAGRDDIAARLTKFCFVKVHQFEKPGTQPEHLSADEVAQLLEGVL